MKKLLTLFAILAFSFSFFAFSSSAQNYVWAKNIGGLYGDAGYSIAVDGAGSCYVTGIFDGTVDFDPGPGTANLTSTDGYGVFFAKYDAGGNYVWAKNISGTNNNYGYYIGVDGAGNCYVAGSFSGTADFDPGTGTESFTAIGGCDLFFAKYDASGNYIWAKSIGSINTDICYKVATDVAGNCYITGNFAGQADFDPGVGIANHTPVGSSDIFFAKYDVNGNYLWAKNIGSIGSDGGHSMAIDGLGYCYLTGHFSDTADFNPGGSPVSLVPKGGADIFLAKYDVNGNNIWAKSMGGTLEDYANTISVDSAGNCYISGWFRGTANFDPDGGMANLASAGNNDIFFAKYTSNGNYLWARKIGGSDNDVSCRLVLDNGGNCYIIGYFYGSVDFDPGAGVQTHTPVGAWDIFFAKYDSNGYYLWAKNIGSTGYDYGYGIAVDASGSCFITGEFEKTADFNPGAGVANLTSFGNNDAFLAKYSQPTGVSENNLESLINVYPNPSSGKIQVQSLKFKVQSLEIYNMQGQQMMQAQFNNQNTMDMDVSVLAKGIYLLKIQSENGVVNKKLVIQ